MGGQIWRSHPFYGQALDAWAYRRGVKLECIRPGKPVENSYAESLNGKLRDECLNTSGFLTLAEARHVVEAWRVQYNQLRPHSSVNNLTPAEFASKTLGMLQTKTANDSPPALSEETAQVTHSKPLTYTITPVQDT
jgi:transposase InsO family protein